MHPSGHQFEETPAYWVNASSFVNSKVANTSVLGIWVIGVDWDDGSGHDECHLTFPQPAGSYPHMSFESQDPNTPYLNAFDAAGQKILFELEPADGNITTEIKLVLDRYASHPCVAGISIDAEWILPSYNTDGKAVSNADAQSWMTQIKSYNPNYLLNIVHWETSHMPSMYRDSNLIIENDGLGSSNEAAWLSDVESWGQYFSNANVGCMIGFDEDWNWIQNITDPVNVLINAAFNNISNCKVVYWAGWTMPDIYTGTQ